MQGAQLAELEVLYKEEQVLRKRYFNTIEGWSCLESFQYTNGRLFFYRSFAFSVAWKDYL